MRRSAKADGEILFSAQQYDDVRLAHFRRGAIEPALEIAEDVGVIIGDQAARLLFVD